MSNVSKVSTSPTMTAADLSTYQLQLQQVEVALTADPDNQELVKLKEDLSQVITITRDIIEQQQGATSSKQQPEDEDGEDGGGAAAVPEPSTSKRKMDTMTPIKHWQVREAKRCG